MFVTPTDLPTRHNIIVVLTINRYLSRKHATETSRQSAHFVQKHFFPDFREHHSRRRHGGV